VTDARGVPLVAYVTAANVNDITHLDALAADLPAVRGRRGRPRRRPNVLQGDRGYDSQSHRDRLAVRYDATTASVTPSSRLVAEVATGRLWTRS
jgi:hypothetical protein